MIEDLAQQGLLVKTEPPGETTPNDPGAIRALAEARAMIAPWTSRGGPAQVVVSLSHDPRVVTRADGYLVLLPGVEVRFPGADGALVVGTVRLLMTPEGPDAYRVAMTLPGRLRLLGRDRAPVATATLPHQEHRMLWSTRHRLAIETDALFEGMRIVDGNDDVHVDFGPVRYVSRTKETGSGRFDREDEVRLDSVHLSVRQEAKGGVTIARVVLRNRMKGLDPIAFERFLRKNGLDRRETGTEAAADAPTWLSAPDLASILDDGETSLSFDGLRVSGAKGVILAIGHGETGVSISGGRTPAGTLGIALGIDDLEDPGGAPLPRRLVVKASLDRLPAQHLTSLLGSLLGEMLELKDSGQGGDDGMVAAAVEGRLDELLRTLVESGTVLRFDDVAVAGDAFDLRLTGSLRPDPAAAYRGVGDIQVDVRGLEAMLAAAMADHGATASGLGLGGKGKSQEKKKTGRLPRLEPVPVDKSAVDPAMLESLRGVAETRADASGRTVDIFRFTLTASGEVFVNARPLTEIMTGKRDKKETPGQGPARRNNRPDRWTPPGSGR
ncbi:MAG: hypothetical protein H7840_18175, partial [Alphaproteobacteria bacterium]